MTAPTDLDTTAVAREVLRLIRAGDPPSPPPPPAPDLTTLLAPPAAAPAARVLDEDAVAVDPAGGAFLIRDGERHPIPDRATLDALTGARYRVIEVPAATLAAVPLAAGPFPSLDVSGLYSTEDGEGRPALVYVERGRAYRVDGDVTTAERFFGRSLPLGAVLGRGAAVVLLQGLQPLDASLAEPANPLLIREYLRTIPLPAITDPPGLTVATGPAQAASYRGESGVAYQVQVAAATVRNVIDEFPALSPVSDVIWPGALLQGSSLTSGQLAPIQIEDRTPGTLTITTNLVAGNPQAPTSVRVERPSGASVTTARRTLLSDLQPRASAGRVKLDFATMHDSNQMSAHLGAKVSGSGWQASADVNVSGSLDTSTTVLKLTQEFFTVAFEPTGSPASYFGDAVTVDTVRQFSGPDNPPCFISQVTYGRVVLLVIESSDNASEVRANVSAAWEAAMSGSLEANAELKRKASSYRVQLATVGVTGATAFKLVGSLTDALVTLAATADISAANPGEVISYAARYLVDGSLAGAVLGPFGYTAHVRADLPVESYSYRVWDEYGFGVPSVRTGISVRRGDRVTITARGSVEAGWLFGSAFGPAGDTSQRGREINNDTKPLRDAPYTSLLYGFGQGWFYWAANPTFVYGTTKSGDDVSGRLIGSEATPLPLELTINDDRLDNGKGSFGGEIYIQRRPLAAAGEI